MVAALGMPVAPRAARPDPAGAAPLRGPRRPRAAVARGARAGTRRGWAPSTRGRPRWRPSCTRCSGAGRTVRARSRPISAGLVGLDRPCSRRWPGRGPSWLVAGLVVAAAITFGATLVPGMALLTRAADAAGLDGVLAIALANLAWALGHAVGSPLCGWLADRAGDTVTYLAFACNLSRSAGSAPEYPPRPRHASLVTRRRAAA